MTSNKNAKETSKFYNTDLITERSVTESLIMEALSMPFIHHKPSLARKFVREQVQYYAEFCQYCSNLLNTEDDMEILLSSLDRSDIWHLIQTVSKYSRYQIWFTQRHGLPFSSEFPINVQLLTIFNDWFHDKFDEIVVSSDLSNSMVFISFLRSLKGIPSTQRCALMYQLVISENSEYEDSIKIEPKFTSLLCEELASLYTIIGNSINHSVNTSIRRIEKRNKLTTTTSLAPAKL